MSSSFPRTRSSKRGYDPVEVDEFLALARSAYDADRPEVAQLSAADIRHTAFGLKKGGYSTAHVDAALERLEDAFAFRERERAQQERGPDSWFDDAKTTAQVILNRLARPKKHRFDRAGILTIGYNRAEVDGFSQRLSSYFQDSTPMSIEEVRTVVFRQQRGGYREAQVDLVLDGVTDVMLAVR